MSIKAEGRTGVRRRLRNLALGAMVAGGSLAGVAAFAGNAHAQPPSGNPCYFGTGHLICHIHAGGGGGGGGGGGTGTITLPGGLGTIHAGGGGGGGAGGGASINIDIPVTLPMIP